MALDICDWKYGKRWVYSITYDEALVELHEHAVPIHEEYGVPGHIEAVSGHIGVERQIGASSYNGFHHMSGEQMREMVDRGWGVGNHSWSHENITPETVELEVGKGKEVLEEAIGGPVDLYCSPGNNTNMADHVLEACRKHGYLGAMSLTDALNRPEDELFWLNRTALHDQYYEPFYSEYDPFRNIRHAQVDAGWIIDYCHCPLPEVVHRNKDCSSGQLRSRFETVLAEGGEEVWCAVPEEVIYYHLTRRHTTVEELAESETELGYRLKVDGLSDRVRWRTLTLEADVPAAWCRDPKAWVNGELRAASVVMPGRLRVDVEAADGVEIANAKCKLAASRRARRCCIEILGAHRYILQSVRTRSGRRVISWCRLRQCPAVRQGACR